MNIKLNKLIIENFMSFGKKPTEIDLDTDLTTLILGENRDVGAEGYSRNGVGKSTMFQALVWVLFNEGIENIKQDQFVNLTNKKGMSVTLYFEVDGVELVLKRGRKPNTVSLTKDGEPYTMHSVDTVDDSITALIGMSYDTFTQTQLLSTNVEPFMKKKPAPQRDFMEKLVGLDLLTKRAGVLKAKMKDVAMDIRLEEQQVLNDERNYEKIKDRIEDLTLEQASFIKNQKSIIMDLDEQLTLAESVDIEEHKEINRQVEENRKAKQKRVDEFTAEQKELNGKLDELNDEKESEVAAAKQEVDLKISNTSLLYSKKKDEFKLEADNVKEGLRENVELRQEELNEHNAKYERFNNEISEWEREIQSTDVLKDEIDSLKSGICPFCKQEHVDEDKVKELETKLHSIRKKNDQLDADIKVNTLELEFIENNATLVHEELTESQTVLAKHIDNTDKILKSLRDEEQAMLDVLTEERGKKVNTIKRKYTKLEKEYNDQLEELSAIDFNVEFADMILESEYSDEDLAAIVKEIEMIKVHIKKEKETVNPYDKLLKEAEKELKDSEVDKTKLYELKETEEHYKILIKLLTENKSFVRKNLLDQYVPFLNQRIDHYAVQLGLPHEVIINNDLTTDITYMTHSVSYGNLSNGERGRLNFAVSMAFRDLLKASGHSFNVLLVDELLDNGIDTSGFHDIFKIVKKEVKGSLFIISHRDDLVTDVDNIMTVVKENGFTHIVETD